MGLEYVVIGSGENRFYTLMESEMIDFAEFHREIRQRFLDAALGDLDNWQPVGILNAGPVIHYDRESQNARAVEWWRSQRPRPPMTLAEAMTKIRTEFGGALDQLGRG
jgi:hypothetical protein